MQQWVPVVELVIRKALAVVDPLLFVLCQTEVCSQNPQSQRQIAGTLWGLHPA